MAPSFSFALVAAATLALALSVVAKYPEECRDGQCQEGDDASALISSLISVQRHAQPELLQKQQARWSRGQRSDDLVAVPRPTAQRPKARLTALPIPTPLPPPNPNNNSFIANYTPMNCMQKTWPFFMEVAGEWVGYGGQDFIALPQVNAMPPFIVQVNNYTEHTTFESIGGPVLNRGYLDAVQVNPMNQSDQVLMGLLYTQKVMDNDLRPDLAKACAEVNANITDPWNILRQGAIPHG
eukprot:CAMPEP_0203945216 /NCGR_PEP_ID=MMETSP0359-20131031/80787_1 /ASSEMBLY_ACC=CAM_ASM_000338 /TAXON_ID=268821 /ORGANISM="Scrippsiella Hangoei, Strain SHTV-5" /LENGTH=238 /DNA_ID=CAMNT_0050876349 /DNA_START=20 /DNA_END=733 /DNA_ORIENTATION=-